MAHIEDTSPPLDEAGIKRIQKIVGAVLLYGRGFDNKLLVTLNTIGTQQAAATEATNAAVNQMLDYLAKYTNDIIVYVPSDMILATHSDSGFHNESRGRSGGAGYAVLQRIIFRNCPLLNRIRWVAIGDSLVPGWLLLRNNISC